MLLENVGALLSCQEKTRKVFKYLLKALCFKTILPSVAGFKQLPGMQEAWFENVLGFPLLEERGIGCVELISWECILVMLLRMCFMSLNF